MSRRDTKEESTGPSKRVLRGKSNQPTHPEAPQVLPEDDPAVEEFCRIVATILVRVLASKGKEAYNGGRNNYREAGKR